MSDFTFINIVIKHYFIVVACFLKMKVNPLILAEC